MTAPPDPRGGPRVPFDLAFDRLIGSEGGYVNDPDDPGGETKFGISKRSYPHLIIADLTRESVKPIYKRDFWDRLHAETLPGSVAFQAFDFAVTSGIETAVRYLQRAVGVADDGQWGPVSQAAAAAQPETDTILRLNAERLDFLTRLANWPTAGRGWARRIAANLRDAAVDA
jgi:lysozyme family protein